MPAEESLPPRTLLLVTIVTDLLLERPTCRSCVVDHLESRAAADDALTAIGQAVVVHRPVLTPCVSCGAVDDVLLITLRAGEAW